MFEVKRITLFEENGELTALRPEPETILTAKGVDVQTGFAGRDKIVVDPAVAGATGGADGARHHPALIGRHDGHLRGVFPLAENDDVDVLFEKGNVFGECHFFFGMNTGDRLLQGESAAAPGLA